MKSLKRWGAVVFALGAATAAAQAGSLSIQSPSLAVPSPSISVSTPSFPVSPDVSPGLNLPDRFVPIDIDEQPGVALRFNRSESIDISGREERPSLQTRMFETEAVLRCKVGEAGSVVVANIGSDPVIAGTTIRWQVKASGERGYFELRKALGAGQSVRARDVLSGGDALGGKCSAKAV